MIRNYDLTRLIAIILTILLNIGCSSTKSTQSSQPDRPMEITDSGYQFGSERNSNQSNIMVHPNADKPSNNSLNDLIIQLPGVRHVGGHGQGSRFVVSGMAGSFMSNTDPLFVVNGQALGTDYSRVHAIVRPNDVTSITVLKGSDATIYGSRGANGVIVIRTR